MLYCYAYLRLSSSYAYYIWAKSPSVMAIPLVTSNIASRVMFAKNIESFQKLTKNYH